MPNFKTPLSTNDLKPVHIQNSATNIQMPKVRPMDSVNIQFPCENSKIYGGEAVVNSSLPKTSNNRKLDPAVLNRIREDSNVSDGTIAPPKNPFRAKTGLLFRDILGRADNTRSCSSCGNKT